MKWYITLLALVCASSAVSAQIFDTETIKYSGDNDKRINLVILSEGYQNSELGQFKADAESLVNDMFIESPFLEYSNYFNVHIIKVPSNQSGADHPGTATDVTEPHNIPVTTVDTYFNATFDAFGFHRFLYYGMNYSDDDSAELKINSVLADNFPTYDQTLILVNTSEYGGTGGPFPISSTSSNEIAIHELGHSMFNLKDEYLLPDVFYAEAINMTKNADPATIKWKNWLNIQDIGIHQHGTSGVPKDWYKPRNRGCKMELLNEEFCAVCKEGMVEKIHDLISPIESYSPTNTSITSPEFPLEFELTLIEPNPNTLKTEWTLNGSNISNDTNTVEITDTDLINGENTLIFSVIDDSPMLKIDNHQTIHVNTVTWTISNSTLGINSIESSQQKHNIVLFPNPANSILNLKFESEDTTTLKAEISSLDGKIIASLTLSNYQNAQFDVSNFSSGMYIIKFYNDNNFLTSKKIVIN